MNLTLNLRTLLQKNIVLYINMFYGFKLHGTIARLLIAQFGHKQQTLVCSFICQVVLLDGAFLNF